MARERGLRIVDIGELALGADVALVQDAATAYETADLCPDVPSVFVAHSEIFDPQSPPQLPGVVDRLVALNDRVAERLRRFEVTGDVVRLHQPIDTERFTAAGPLPERPTRALIVSNNNFSDRREMLESACAANGIEVSHRGGAGNQTSDPRGEMVRADIVIGYGRAILEAMSCGRAAFVYDWAGGSGWVTQDSYPHIEADGFGGRDGLVRTPDELASALAGYDRFMGPVNHDLVIAHHRANVHAQDLIELFESLARTNPVPRTGLDEMARLVRLGWRARAQVNGLQTENAELHRRVGEMGIRLTEIDQAWRAEVERREGTERGAGQRRLTRRLRSIGARWRFR